MHIRRDIAEAIAGAGLRFLRFGGDMAESPEPLPFGYTWRNQIGDPQRRPPKLGGAWYAQPAILTVADRLAVLRAPVC